MKQMGGIMQQAPSFEEGAFLIRVGKKQEHEGTFASP
jgi:hypothetical protein